VYGLEVTASREEADAAAILFSRLLVSPGALPGHSGPENATGRVGGRGQEGHRVRDRAGEPGPAGDVDAGPHRQGPDAAVGAGAAGATEGVRGPKGHAANGLGD